jgi:hypothetical protein
LPTIQELERTYNEAQALDQKVFDEMKSNILLYAGNHFTNRNSKYFENIRGAKQTSDARIRLVKNHLHKICNKYINNIVSFNPGITIIPKNETELRDKKDAELSLAVWKDIKYRHKFNDVIRELVDDFVVLGECWIKVIYDHNKGDLIGFAPLITGLGEETPDHTNPVYSGDFNFEVIPGYDVFRDPGALTFKESRFIGIRKMTDEKELIHMIESDPDFSETEKFEKIKALKSSDRSDTYSIFNASTAQILEDAGKRLIKEYYYKPCSEYPFGKIFITTSNDILWELELPKDRFNRPVYPILGESFDHYRGSPRGYSKIKQMRPGQAEINRTTSKIAETQITLGDDKVYTTMNGGITEGAKLPGVREVKVKAGMKPEVVPGRSGDQYFQYMEFQINDLYRQLDVTDDSQEKDTTPDIMSKLYRSLKEKKAYTIYSDKFERLLVDIGEVVIKTAKAEYRDDKIVRAVGRGEAINIAEFKESDDSSYSIKIEPMSEDIDTIMGKYLVARELLQYAGGQMSPQQIGRIASSELPFIDRSSLKEMNKTSDIIETLLLQMDRGEKPLITPFDDNQSIIDAMAWRMQQNDFKYLAGQKPEIYEIYMGQYDERVKVLNQKMKELKEANMGTIPTGGVQVKIDAWVPDPGSKTGKPMRATVDQVSLQWFLDRLSKDGAAHEGLQDAPLQEQIDIMNVVPMQRGN